jgi:hypothetical protein
VPGAVQITATLRQHALGIAGLMVRESLTTLARHACIYTKGAPDAGKVPLYFSSQTSTKDGIVTLPATSTLERDGVSLPVKMRLTRRGNTIEFHYSTDGGSTWRRAAPAVTFEGLQPLYVGMVSASGRREALSQARFDLPEITRTPLPTE